MRVLFRSCRAAVLVLRSLPGAEAGWLPPLRRRRREEQSQRDGLPLRERPSRGFGQFQRGDTILVADPGHGAIEDVGQVVHLASIGFGGAVEEEVAEAVSGGAGQSERG